MFFGLSDQYSKLANIQMPFNRPLEQHFDDPKIAKVNILYRLFNCRIMFANQSRCIEIALFVRPVFCPILYHYSCLGENIYSSMMAEEGGN